MLYDIPRFLGGLVTGVVLSVVWYNLLSTKFGISVISDQGLEQEGLKGPATLEHYHIGLFFFIIAASLRPRSIGFLEGIGISLIAVEALQNNPFGIGKNHFVTSTVIGVAMLILLVVLYI